MGCATFRCQTKHCVAMSCVCSYPFYEPNSPKGSSNQDDFLCDSSGLASRQTQRSWGESVKAGGTGLMPKLEDVHKEAVKKYGEEPLTGAAGQRYRRVLGQLAAALSRANLSFPISSLSRFQAKPNPAAEHFHFLQGIPKFGSHRHRVHSPRSRCIHLPESQQMPHLWRESSAHP